MSIETDLRRALDALDEYREEGVVLETAVADLLGQRDALEGILAPVGNAADPDRLGDVFLALERHFQHTRQILDVAIDFLAEAGQVSGKTPAETDPGHDPRIALTAEEYPT